MRYFILDEEQAVEEAMRIVSYCYACAPEAKETKQAIEHAFEIYVQHTTLGTVESQRYIGNLLTRCRQLCDAIAQWEVAKAKVLGVSP